MSPTSPEGVESRTLDRVLVTGCAGFIGSHLTESLLKDGIEVLGVDCFNSNYGRAQKLTNLSAAREWDSFEFVPVDLSRGDLDALVAGVDAVFHLAAEPGVRSSWGPRFERYLTNNLSATHQLLAAVHRENPSARVVYASSSSVYGDAESLPTPESATPAPVSPYGMTKLAAEHLCSMYASNFGLSTVSLRYFTVFGPRQRPDMAFHIFAKAAYMGEAIRVFGDGRQSRDFTYVEDIVSGTRSASVAAINPGEAINLGGGLRADLRDVIEVIGECSGRELAVDYQPAQAGDVRNTGADCDRARAVLGFEPQVGLRAGLEAEWSWIEAALAGG